MTIKLLLKHSNDVIIVMGESSTEIYAGQRPLVQVLLTKSADEMKQSIQPASSVVTDLTE